MRFKVPLVSWVTVLMTVVLAATITWWAVLLLGPKTVLAPTAAVNESNTLSDLTFPSQLFGGVAVAAAQAAATPANIQVLGVVADSDRAAAVLTVDGKARAVAIGDEISPGVQLISVGADKVVIKRNGVSASLPAPKTADPDILTAGRAAANMGTGPTTPPPGPLPPSGAAAAPPVPQAAPQQAMPTPAPQQAAPAPIPQSQPAPGTHNTAAGAVRGTIGQPNGPNVNSPPPINPAINPATGQPVQ
jgi:hypothetical protein